VTPAIHIVFSSRDVPAAFPAHLHPAWAADLSALGPWSEGEAGLAAPLSPRWGLPADVTVLFECASTMDEAWTRGARGAWESVVAVRQTQGRGQMRRAWTAPPGNLSASLVLPPLPERLSAMASLLLGHAAATVLEAETGAAIRVKWPNDLLTAGGKAGGILVEERSGRLVAGIGLNLFAAPPLGAMRPGHVFPPAALPAHPEGFGPLRLWLRLLSGMRQEIERFDDDDSSAIMLEMLSKRLACRGELVMIEDGAERFKARVLGISGDGGLLVETFGQKGGVSTLYSGCLFPL